MERRDVLRSASGLAAVSTVGLAGCNGILGGGGCDTPGDNLEDSLPDSSDYESAGNISASAEGENVEAGAAGAYEGPDGNTYIFSVRQYSSEDEATNATDSAGNASDGAFGGDGAIGYLQSGAYVFVAIGPDEDSVTEFMKTSPTLSDGCVDNNIEFV